MLLKLNYLFAFFGAGGKGGLLDVSPGLVFWTFIIFIILLLLLKKFAWKPILSSLDERDNFIKNSLDQAEKAKLEAEQIMLENKKHLAKAEEESRKVIDLAREYSEKLKEQVLEESRVEAKKMIEVASQEIQRKTQESFNKLKSEIADISISAAEKILKENLDKEKNSALVNKYIEDIPRN